MGLEQAREFAQALHADAVRAIAPLGASGQLLSDLADFIVLRNH